MAQKSESKNQTLLAQVKSLNKQFAVIFNLLSRPLVHVKCIKGAKKEFPKISYKRKALQDLLICTCLLKNPS